jgi:hypothetical protein
LAPSLLSPSTGVLGPGDFHLLTLQMTSHDRSAGTYTAMMHVTVNDGADGAANIPVTLHIFDTIYRAYLPLLQRTAE